MPKSEYQNIKMSIRLDNLITVDPITDHQKEVFDNWNAGNHLALVGTAGTGKTFLGVYLALEEVMDKSTPFESLRIVRSVVPTREVGYLPGTLEDKLEAFTGPYRSSTAELFGMHDAYDRLLHNKYISFGSTSYLRGMTYSNCIVLVDEMQNLNFHELDSIITRMGPNSRIIFCGDYHQSDFKQDKDKNGITLFLDIISNMSSFGITNFGWEDIVRSDFVRDYIMTKEWMNIK